MIGGDDDWEKVTEVKLNEWIADYTRYIASETINILVASSAKKGSKVTRRILMAFISHLIEVMVTRTFKDQPKTSTATKKEKYDHVRKNYNTLKQDLQDSIADGFNRACKKFPGETILDYYCEIKVMPEPTKTKYNH